MMQSLNNGNLNFIYKVWHCNTLKTEVNSYVKILFTVEIRQFRKFTIRD